jgi:hypothetical protein
VLPWAAAEAQRLSTNRWRGDVRYTDKIEGRDGDIDMPVLVCWGIEDTPKQLLTFVDDLGSDLGSATARTRGEDATPNRSTTEGSRK